MKPFSALAAAALLLLPAVAGAQEAQGYAPAPEAKLDIVETAQKAGSFTTLTQAIEAAGLSETLKGEGPFTVFAPTDEAFAKLPEGTLESLLQDRQALAGILKYHVVPGKIESKDVAQLAKAQTAAGKELKISAANGKVMVGNATVTQADIPASNGVIHVIDSVLLPE